MQQGKTAIFVCVCVQKSLPSLPASQPSRFTLGEICSTILPPPASLPRWRPAQKVETEIWVMAKCCAPVTRSLPCVEDRIPAGPFCYRADSLPVRTNAGLWKINLSHSHDNMFPQVMMRRQFWRIRQGQLLIFSTGRMSITSNGCLSMHSRGTLE